MVRLALCYVMSSVRDIFVCIPDHQQLDSSLKDQSRMVGFLVEVSRETSSHGPTEDAAERRNAFTKSENSSIPFIVTDG